MKTIGMNHEAAPRRLRASIALLALTVWLVGLTPPASSQSFWQSLGRAVSTDSGANGESRSSKADAADEAEQAEMDEQSRIERAIAIEALPHHLLMKVGMMKSFGEEVDVKAEWVTQLARIREYDRIEHQLNDYVSDERADSEEDLESVDNEKVRDLKGQLDLGLEIGDLLIPKNKDVFRNPANLTHLGENPVFVYTIEGESDPMLVPWMTRRAIYVELMQLVEHKSVLNQPREMSEIVDELVKMEDPRFKQFLDTLKKDLDQHNRKDALLAAVQEGTESARPKAQVKLPSWVESNTLGVIIDPGNDICLIGSYMLKVGESLPNYPDVTVEKIEPSSVTYRVKGKTFTVPLPEG